MMMKTEAIKKLFVLAAAVGTLQGCIWVEDPSDLRTFVRETQSRPKGRIEPLPEFKPYHSFVYEGASMRDPFQPLVEIVLTEEDQEPEQILTDLQPDQERPKAYLERFSIEQLTMVGTISSPGEEQLWALLKDSNGEVHRITQGGFLGFDYGEVQTVTETHIEVIEIISNGRGGWMKRPRNVALQEEQLN